MNQITQAFVLGAGLGKRLRPLTDDLPKPLVPIFQKPLITFALDHLIDIGVSRFVINTHKLPESFRNFFGKNGYRGCSTTLVHEPDLLETGGGIKNAERYLGVEPFITYSGDILTDIALRPLIDEHFLRANVVRMITRAVLPRCRSGFAGLSRHRYIEQIRRARQLRFCQHRGLEWRNFSADPAASKNLFRSDYR